MLLRVPVGGTVRVEQARSLHGGHVIEEDSGHIHTDLRGSVVARTSYRNISLDGVGAHRRTGELRRLGQHHRPPRASAAIWK